MRRQARGFERGLVVTAIAIGVIGVGRANAQAPSPGAQAPEAPVVRFAPTGISVAEAVRVALENDPAVKQARAAVQLRQGVAQEQRGVFDWTLFAKVFYSYRQQELPESRKEIERKKRAQIEKGLNENRDKAAKSRQLSGLLNQVRNAPASDAQLDAISQIDPEIASELRIIDLLIDGTVPTAADGLRVERTNLINRLVSQLDSGLTRLDQGVQDAETLLQNLGDAPSDEYFEQLGGQAQVSKLFRSGVQFTPFFQGQRDGTNYLDKPKSAEFGGKGVEDLYTFKAGFNAVLPLARNRGSVATAGAERAALIEVDASEQALLNESALSALDAVLRYWDLRAAQDSLEVAQQILERQTQLVELTRAQADAGTIPRIELSRVQAGEARARTRVETSERSLVEARVALAVAMGVAVTEEDATLPRASDAFPASPQAASLAEPAITTLATEALDRRPDVQALSASVRSGQVLVDTAQTFLRPRLDLVTKMWWTSLGELAEFKDDPTDPAGLRRITEPVSITSALDRWVGPSAEVALEFERPLGNNQPQGRLQQRRADLLRRQIGVNDLRRLVRLGVVRTARTLNDAVARVQHAEDAVKFYQATIDGEMERYRAGDITLIDAILTVDQQADALLTLVSARQQVAQLIAQLRYESGQLLDFRQGQAPVIDNVLITVPQAGGGR